MARTALSLDARTKSISVARMIPVFPRSLFETAEKHLS